MNEIDLFRAILERMRNTSSWHVAEYMKFLLTRLMGGHYEKQRQEQTSEDQ